MTLEDILRNEKQNEDRIFLYREEDGYWYAYEHSAFYCYSLLGIVDIGWMLLSPEDANSIIVRVRIPNPDRLANTPLLKVLKMEEAECVISCRNSCRGFRYWREMEEERYAFSLKRQKHNKLPAAKEIDEWYGILFNHNNKTREMSVLKQTDVPVIEEVYDPLSQRRDGTITPCAPILITGSNLLCWPKEQVSFYLCPVEEPGRMIAVDAIYKHAEDQMLVTLPDLDKGEYHPVLCLKKDGEAQTYYFPVTWQVKSVNLVEIYRDRRNVYHPWL